MMMGAIAPGPQKPLGSMHECSPSPIRASGALTSTA
jgi:hypothetical protein